MKKEERMPLAVYCCDCERAHLSYVRLSGDAEQKGKRRLRLVSAYPSVIPYTRYTLLRSILALILSDTNTELSDSQITLCIIVQSRTDQNCFCKPLRKGLQWTAPRRTHNSALQMPPVSEYPNGRHETSS